ncbi:Nif3-like dinuclear metal center hexameric protein [bacterium]|nr:Nif3-like dinuclear metal center hexameric protein [bacterium]
MAPGAFIPLGELTAYLDELLEIGRWEAADASLNGLQVEGAPRVGALACAVDASRQTIDLCLQSGANLLIVHHGLFWGKPLAITGSHRARVKALLDAGISLYTAHLPLDFHPTLGHNAVLARQLELTAEGPLATEKGLPVGLVAASEQPTEREAFVRRLDNLLDTSSQLLPFGPGTVQHVGICSGGGAKLLTEPLSRRIDTFVTGEASHTVYHFAREWGVNVLFAGHYATETPGLRALAGHLSARFGLGATFLDAPTGL